MRYPIKISSVWRPFFSLFGFSRKSSYVELNGKTLKFCFGTASETLPVKDVSRISRRRWPFFYGLGPKLGPKGGVAYVGSTEGVVEIQLAKPHSLNVWGPFRRSKARTITVSLEEPQAFISGVRKALKMRADATQ